MEDALSVVPLNIGSATELSSIAPAGPVATKTALVMLDGEYNQIHAIIGEAALADLARANQLVIVKLSASCSKTQQPNDVMCSFLLLHKYYRSSQFREMDITTAVRPPHMQHAMELIKEIPKASRDTFEKYFLSLNLINGTAFTPSNIMKGWYLPGVGSPPSVERALRLCPTITKSLTPEQFQNTIKKTIAIAVNGVSLNDGGCGGTISDAVMEAELGCYFGPVVNGTSNSSTTELVPNRWKTTILTDPTMMEYLQRKHRELEVAAAEKQERQLEAERMKQLRAQGKVKTCDSAKLMCCKEKVNNNAWLEGHTNWLVCTVPKCSYSVCSKCGTKVMGWHMEGAHGV